MLPSQYVETLLNQFELNSSFFFHFAWFGVLFLVVEWVFFRPFLRLIEFRKEKTVRTKERAEQLLEQAREKMETYQTKMQNIQAQEREAFENVLQKARSEEMQILLEARKETRAQIQQALGKTEQMKTQILKELEKEIPAFSEKICEKLLPKKVG